MSFCYTGIKFRKSFTVLTALAASVVLLGAYGTGLATGQNARQIRSPQPASWIVDQTNTLSEYQKDLIDKLCRNVKSNSRYELAVAIVKTTGGMFPRQFATDLFNHWKIGGRSKHDGILIFLAVEDRKAEIILGDGIDDDRSRQLAKDIMDDVMIPHLKDNDAGSAVYEGVHECARQILNAGPLQVDAQLPEINAEAGPAAPMVDENAGLSDPMMKGTVGDGAKTNRNGFVPPNSRQSSDSDESDAIAANVRPTQSGPGAIFNRDANLAGNRSANRAPQGLNSGEPANKYQPPIHQRPWFPWAIGFGVLGTLGTVFGARYYWRYRSRICETCQIEMVLLTEVQDDEFLEAPQLLEEKIGSVDYDVWACLECEDVVSIRHARWITRYSKCPQCSYVTRFKIKKTVLPATTISGGLVRVNENCKNCEYHHTYTYATPRIQQQRRRSSGGGFRSGGGFSGGFGGGRSSGGGASGSW